MQGITEYSDSKVLVPLPESKVRYLSFIYSTELVRILAW